MPTSGTDSLAEADAAAGNIREIVAMVKSGKINKSDAFNELRHLLKHSSSGRVQRSDDTGAMNEEEKAVHHPQVPPPNPSESIDFSPSHQKSSSSTSIPSTQSRFSKEDRRILINTLIEKKRRDRLQQSTIMDDDDISYDQERYDDQYIENNDRYPEQGRMEYDDPLDGGEREEYQPTGYEESNQEEGFGLNFREFNDASSISSSGIHSRNSRERPRSAGRLGGSSGRQQFRSMAFSNRANDDSRLSDFRAQKVRMAESATRAEMFKECTFEPKIKDLPSSYGVSKDQDDHFYDRVMRWQREKEIEATRRKTLAAQNEVVDCTFQPRISRNSQRSVRMTRGTESAKKDTPSRLYESNSSIIMQREKFIEEQKKKEVEESTKECTFQPRINKKQAWDYVEPKYNKDKGQPSPSDEVQLRSDNKLYTFTPKVNEVRKSMNSAKLYLSMNVVDRLTKPIPAEPEDSDGEVDDKHFDSGVMDRPVMDVASFMGSLQGQGPYNTPANKRPNSAGSTRRKSGSSTTVSSRHTLTAEEKELRNRSFKDFLGRQNQTLLKKEKKTEELQQSLEPKIKTHVNNKSRRIVAESHKGDFIDRVQRDVLRREQAESLKLTARGRDKECSFQPEVSKKAEMMRSRSVYEMSRGDAHKQETSRRLLKLKSEQEELRNLTFQPRIATSPTRQTRSALQLRDNPGGFMERHMNTLQQNEAERKKILEQRNKEELAACTFVPKTKDCPAYVKRIARSLSVVKKSQTGDDRPTRPQWR